MRALVAALALLSAPAAAAGFGDSSMGRKPYGVLLLAPDTGAAFRTELTYIRSQLQGVPLDSVETFNDGTMVQRAVDRLNAQHVSKIIAIPLDLVSESAGMEHLRYLFGIREQPVTDRPDETRPPTAPVKSLHKSNIVVPGRGPKRLQSKAELVLTATIDKSPALASILGDRALALSRDPAKEAVVLVGVGPRSDQSLEPWKTAASAIAESVRVKGGFRESGIIWVRDGIRAGQQDTDRSENRAALRALVTSGGVVAVPLALDGRRAGRMLQRQLGSGSYRWDGKGVLGDPRLAEWIVSVSKAASALPDVRRFKDNAQGGFR